MLEQAAHQWMVPKQQEDCAEVTQLLVFLLPSKAIYALEERKVACEDLGEAQVKLSRPRLWVPLAQKP